MMIVLGRTALRRDEMRKRGVKEMVVILIGLESSSSRGQSPGTSATEGDSCAQCVCFALRERPKIAAGMAASSARIAQQIMNVLRRSRWGGSQRLWPGGSRKIGRTGNAGFLGSCDAVAKRTGAETNRLRARARRPMRTFYCAATA